MAIAANAVKFKDQYSDLDSAINAFVTGKTAVGSQAPIALGPTSESRIPPERGASADAGGKTYQTYTKTNPITGEVYSGRTSGTGSPAENVAARDRKHHMTDKGFGPAVLDASSSRYEAIRGREQMLIEYHGGA